VAGLEGVLLMRGIYAAKQWFGRLLSPITRLAVFIGISPDLFTFIGVAGGALAGIGVWQLQAWLVLVGVIVRLAGANLDGAVARARNLSSRRGFWINELGDRLADFAILAGFVALAWAQTRGWNVVIQAVAMLVAVAPTLVSLWGHRRGLPRLNGGPFGKSERAFGAVLVVFLLQLGTPMLLTLESWGALVVFGSLVTAEVRARKISSELN
jgi:CDP-diacylglycerol---glycerol-3-phosphate 3-phosphatidyltransferase